MPRYSKTIYVEIEADDEEDALVDIAALLEPLMSDPRNNVSYVDFEGPIEEVDG